MIGISLFSGIGGIDLGFQRAGIITVVQVENDPFCSLVLEKHWPDVLRYKDIREVKAADLPYADILFGGFPCQDISIAKTKNRKYLEGKNSGLWYEYYRLIDEIRPCYIFVENVPNLVNNGLEVIIEQISNLGYDTEWGVIPASFVGAPHTRKRLFLVAYPVSQRCGYSIITNGEYEIPHNKEWDSTKNITTGSGWKRWIISSSKTMGRDADNPWFVRMDDGVPRGLDKHRIKALGNAVVPQISEMLGKRIVKHYEITHSGKQFMEKTENNQPPL